MEGKVEYTKFEKARIIGSRALQIAMGAPILIKFEEKDLEDLRFNPIRIAMKEYELDLIPITVKRPFPTKKAQIPIPEKTE